MNLRFKPNLIGYDYESSQLFFALLNKPMIEEIIHTMRSMFSNCPSVFSSKFSWNFFFLSSSLALLKLQQVISKVLFFSDVTISPTLYAL